MKIELIKKDKLEGTFFYTKIDGLTDNVYQLEQEAQSRYDYLVERAETFVATETVIKSIEI